MMNEDFDWDEAPTIATFSARTKDCWDLARGDLVEVIGSSGGMITGILIDKLSVKGTTLIGKWWRVLTSEGVVISEEEGYLTPMRDFIDE